jgi:hypothetical protein
MLRVGSGNRSGMLHRRHEIMSSGRKNSKKLMVRGGVLNESNEHFFLRTQILVRDAIDVTETHYIS